jgi:hypothetical protein
MNLLKKIWYWIRGKPQPVDYGVYNNKRVLYCIIHYIFGVSRSDAALLIASHKVKLNGAIVPHDIRLGSGKYILEIPGHAPHTFEIL